MSKKKSNNYSDLSIDELNKKLKDFKTEHFNLRFQVVVNQLENLARFKVVKKEIARIKTELNKPSRKSEPVKAQVLVIGINKQLMMKIRKNVKALKKKRSKINIFKNKTVKTQLFKNLRQEVVSLGSKRGKDSR